MYYFHFRRLVIIFFVLFYLINYFFNSPAAATIYRILLFIVVLLGITQLPRTNLLVSTGLFAAGGIMLIINGANIQDWLIAISNNAGLVALFITAPLLGLPFFYNDYENELKNLMQLNINSVFSFSLIVFVITHILGIVISVGAVPLIYEVFIGSARFLKVEKTFVRSLLRGYVSTGFWSPIWASMAAVTASLKLSWLSIIPYGIFFAVVCLVISIVFQHYETLRDCGQKFRKDKIPGINVKSSSIITMLVLFASLILLIIFFDLFTSWQLLIIIPVVAVMFPLLSALVMRKIHSYKQGLVQYYEVSLLKTKNEVILFTAAGFLGKALEMSKAGDFIPQLIPEWLGQYPLITIILICTLMVLFSLIGIHPVVTGSGLLSAINPAALNLSTMIFGLVILLGWDACILMSPFSATNLIVSGLTGEPCWKVSLKNNGIFGVVMIITMSFLITLFI